MSLRRGEERVRALAERYGKATVARNMKRLQSYSEKMMRAALRDIPDGTYEFEDFLDDDGAGGPPVRIAVSDQNPVATKPRSISPAAILRPPDP